MTELERAAKLVRRERISRGWSQNELAATAKVGTSTLERIEQGKPPVPTLRTMQKIAIAVGKHYDPKTIAFMANSTTLDENVAALSEEIAYDVPTFELAVAAGRWTDAIEIAELLTPRTTP